MLVEKITSRQNPLVKRFRRVQAGAERGFVFIEGVRLVGEALAARAHFETIAFTSAVEQQERGRELFELLRAVSCRGANVSVQVMQAISDTDSPQGIAAIVSRPFFELEAVLNSDKILVIADRLQDPGNLGTIIRTAEAAGVAALVATRNTVDPFNQKALRASMGSAFRLPLVTGARMPEIVSLCRDRNIRLLVTVPRTDGESVSGLKARVYTESRLKDPFALVLGSESQGISEESSRAASELVYVPMAPGVESLNVASAAAVILYESARQRNFAWTKKKRH
jgi:TrmH family RNA methyltransferase